MSMNAYRRYLVPLGENEPATGELYFTEGVPTHRIVTLVEWSNVSRGIFDSPNTVWKELGFHEKPLCIEDKDGEPVNG